MAVDTARAKSLFLAASDLADPDERVAYLNRECGGDPELLERVQGLLRANDASPLPEPEPKDTAGALIDAAAAINTVIAGKYKLVEEIGEGGMGHVYLAQQTAPVKRVVALKLIKHGMDSKQVLARFEAERQALALMDHPNIAKVLDAGTTTDGRPYFVMELVKGVPITRFCDERRLTPRQRLNLLIPVCLAIQHAHQKGVIHRDIKPSNVLVALYDDKPVPKVIDFGIAKATGQQLSEATMHTGFGAVVGTVEYMSPEQASFNQLDVDTRSDIYSLGVLLYELLTGSPPFSRKELEQAGVLEMLRVIREQEPSKPSIKLSTAEALPTLAANRGTEPAKLTRHIRGELDWIVMKALEKDRSRRYETASSLAMDLQRYLSDEPVQAGPPSATYRLRKFLRRNRGPVLVLVLVLLMVLVGLTVSNLLIREEQKRTQEANAQLQSANRRVTANLGVALQTLDEIYLKVAEQRLPRDPKRQQEDLELLKNALTFYERFAQDNSSDLAVRQQTGKAHRRGGEIHSKLGNQAEAAEAFLRAIKLQESLTADFPADPQYKLDLAESINVLAVLRKNTNRLEDAERGFGQAIDLIAGLPPEIADQPQYQHLLAGCHNNLGNVLWSVRPAAAEEAYRRAIALHEKLVAQFPATDLFRESLSRAHMNLGAVLHGDPKRRTQTEEAYRRAADLLRENRGAKGPEHVLGLAGALNNLGAVLADHGKLPEAEQAFRDALALKESVAAEFPAVPDYQNSLGGTLRGLARVQRMRGKPKEARPLLERGVSHRQAALKVTPRHPRYLDELRGDYLELAETLEELGEHAEVVKVAEQLMRIFPDGPEEYLRAGAFLAISVHLAEKDTRLAETTRKATAQSYVERMRDLLQEADRHGANRSEGTAISGDVLYNASCTYAELSERNLDDQSEAYRVRAIEMLRRAMVSGWNDLDLLQTDSSLNSLRGRSDFQNLVRECQARAKTKVKRQ